MPGRKSKRSEYKRTNIYIKPVDFELFEWAKNQRQSLSELIALALMDSRKKMEGKTPKS
jgi:hypothetical protein